MKRKIVKWHLYAGLLFFPCFIIFGVSSLHFNHHFGFMKKSDDTRSFQKQIVLPHYVDNKQFSEEVRDSLQLMGTISPWGMANDSGGFRFVVVHPGCEYGITAHFDNNTVTIRENRKGFWPVFNALHAFNGKLPGNNSLLVSGWSYYQSFSALVMLFSIISGIYIFLKRKNERTAGLYILFSAVSISFFIMLSVWL
ncbi:MAG: PepSY-associated TM helix domain-containing protein [Bacteroidetes bacterium]|nr:PepSY-associated TM helix domain-containing protein [Bacteroidota bacterium]